MNLKGINALVVGAGKSGVAAAMFLAARGANVLLNDRSDMGHLKALEKEGISLVSGEHRAELFIDKELIVLSPGVPANAHPLSQVISDAELSGAEVISEVELASRFVKAPVIAVAGTNGKSTTTSLIGEILEHGGKKVFTGGNLGVPFTQYALESDLADTVVLEVSSFQLERIERFRPWISVLLNITPDHLDRYGSMKEYVEAKGRLFMNQEPEDFAVVNMDDNIVAEFSSQINARIIPFGSVRPHPGGVYLKGANIVSDIEGKKAEFNLESIDPDGIHNPENLMASIAVSLLCDIPQKLTIEAIEGFRGLSHRMEYAGERSNVRFYDDSKATNVGALMKNLETVKKKVVLIAGGKDKGGAYEPLVKLVSGKVRGLVLIGEAAGKIRAALGESAPTVLASSMEEAVDRAWSLARSGDIVLLSPACSSFDMFTGYAERGDVFKRAVLRLIDENGSTGEEAVNA